MEKRKEYDEGDIVVCPKCDSDDVDYSEAPGWGKCQSCGLEFQVKTALIWNEPSSVERGASAQKLKERG